MLTSYELCWNRNLGNWDVKRSVGEQDCVKMAMNKALECAYERTRKREIL
jgi:hypothetical protein